MSQSAAISPGAPMLTPVSPFLAICDVCKSLSLSCDWVCAPGGVESDKVACSGCVEEHGLIPMPLRRLAKDEDE